MSGENDCDVEETVVSEEEDGAGEVRKKSAANLEEMMLAEEENGTGSGSSLNELHQEQEEEKEQWYVDPFC